MLGERVLQVWWWYLHWFRRYRKENQRGGLEIAPPPSGARVNFAQLLTDHRTSNETFLERRIKNCDRQRRLRRMKEDISHVSRHIRTGNIVRMDTEAAGSQSPGAAAAPQLHAVVQHPPGVPAVHIASPPPRPQTWLRRLTWAMRRLLRKLESPLGATSCSLERMRPASVVSVVRTWPLRRAPPGSGQKSDYRLTRPEGQTTNSPASAWGAEQRWLKRGSWSDQCQVT